MWRCIMAGKKPAKRNVSNGKEIKIELPGKAIKVIGFLGNSFSCAKCNRTLSNGIMYEHTDNKLYCTRRCIPAKEVA